MSSVKLGNLQIVQESDFIFGIFVFILGKKPRFSECLWKTLTFVFSILFRNDRITGSWASGYSVGPLNAVDNGDPSGPVLTSLVLNAV